MGLATEDAGGYIPHRMFGGVNVDSVKRWSIVICTFILKLQVCEAGRKIQICVVISYYDILEA